jgi:hypothetical protein
LASRFSFSFCFLIFYFLKISQLFFSFGSGFLPPIGPRLQLQNRAWQEAGNRFVIISHELIMRYADLAGVPKRIQSRFWYNPTDNDLQAPTSQARNQL